MALSFPLVNGVQHDYSSVEILVNALRFKGVKSISYKSSLKPGKARGTAAQVAGRSRGQYDAEGSMEMYLGDWALLSTTLALSVGGLMESPFLVSVVYSELLAGTIVDTLLGARVTDVEQQPQEGDEPITVKLTLDLMGILYNGKAPFNKFVAP